MRTPQPTSRIFLRAIRLCSVVAAVFVIAASMASGAVAAMTPTWSAISAGVADTCAVTSAGGAECWGSDFFGALGDGKGGDESVSGSDTPVAVSGLSSGVTAISSGERWNACAVTSGGGVDCWGDDEWDQLGIAPGPDTSTNTPVAVSGLSSGVTTVDVGESSIGLTHVCALSSAGAVDCWGDDGDGQLGNGTVAGLEVCEDGDAECSYTPLAVIGLSSGVAAITSGGGDTCALTSAGAVYCWGGNEDGELGDGTSTGPQPCEYGPCSYTPVAVSGLSSGVTAITSGGGSGDSGFHTCALTSAGAVYCWGDNSYGELGDGTTTDSDTPVAVSGLSGAATAIAAGDGYTCAVMRAGGVECWGDDGAGQLGNGTSPGLEPCKDTNVECIYTPVAVSGLSSRVTAVTAGGAHTCALLTDGAAECWGDNADGDLGDCSMTQSATPVTVGFCAQAITWEQQGPYTSGQAPVALDATASSGLPVRYTVISGPCTVSGSTLTLTGGGSCVIDANQPGNVGYSAAATVSQTITINPATRPITAPTLAPQDTTPPVITGPASAGHTLRCSTGTWANDPIGYAYQWYRDGTPLAGASASTYALGTLDEGTTLTCVVTAFNAAGQASATSNAVRVPIPHVPRCPGATGVMTGTSIGQIKLGMTRARAEYLYRRHSNRGKQYEDFFCLTPIGVRVGYATPKLFRILTKDEQRQLKRRVVWASTSNPNYELHGVRPGESLTDASSQLKSIEPPFHIGPNYWYLARGARYTAVLKVRGGIVQELGIAENALTATRSAQNVLMHSFY